MRKKILFLAGLCTQLFSLSLFAQKNINVDQGNMNSLLWKVSGNGLEKPSYLFGTIHMICNNDYFFNEEMKKAFAATKKLILEIDLADPKTLVQYQQGMMLPAGKELKNFFGSDQEYEIFSQKLKQHTGIDATLFQNLKPLILLSLMAQKSFECENTSSYEMNLIEMGKENNMTVAGLETTIAQMKIFDDMKDDEIKRILMEGIDDMEQEHVMQNEMIAAYKKQHIDSLLDIILSAKEFRHQEEALIYDRNKEWVEKLPAHMKEAPCFVAVGAGHLAGQKGVIHLLRQKGYEVEPVKN